jgi:hypothetical protein
VSPTTRAARTRLCTWAAETVAATGASSVFSDGNCAATVTYFDSDLAQIESVVDFEVMRAQKWANTAEIPVSAKPGWYF